MSFLPATADFEIPQRSGEVLCVPPARDFLALAEANRRALGRTALVLAGMPLDEIRRAARAALLQAANAYAAQLGLPVTLDPRDPRPLIGTGHQPFLFHPGIWAKHLLAARLADRAVVVNMPVDCDVAEDIGADAPHLDGGLRVVRETLLRAEPDVPYEAIAAPAAVVWQGFLVRLDEHLQTLPRRGVHQVFADFIERTQDLRAPDVGAFLTLARRRHEGPAGYGELPVSLLAATDAFRRFALHIIAQADRFAEIYNARLDAYRQRQNIRTAAQPFPNLTRAAGRTELPFWIIHRGRRRPLFVTPRRGGCVLYAGDEALPAISGRDPEELAPLAIRPRALPLTAFTRLCVVDLFIHGVGGGRYDRVTDGVIAEFFGLEPPAYAVVSATLHLPLSEFDPGEEREALRRRRLILLHNPERLLDDPTEAQRRWIEEKWTLIRQLEGAALTRRERRAATQRIREINERLRDALEAEQRRIELRLAALAEIGRASAATYRGYPFCFFPRRAVDALVDAMWEAAP
ncbi:MAG TPA: hypothetical protein VNN19_08540 [bacterium]|nr:hypothetical protein [bacterium]